ncbi:MAG: polysaccharide deacetylase family protein [Chitinophagaceae bacterium]
MYHRVVSLPGQGRGLTAFITREKLNKQLTYLKKMGYETLTFGDLERVDPKDYVKKIILTFDDGYEDNYENLFPLLKKFGFKAVIFSVTGLQYNDWDGIMDQQRIPLMSWEQMEEMDSYGVEFGGHTRNHIRFDQVSLPDAFQEIMGCKQDLESGLKKPAISFAYPFGAISEPLKTMVREAGYRFGIATKYGPSEIWEDPFQIKRIEVSQKTYFLAFKLKVSGYYNQPFYGLSRFFGF